MVILHTTMPTADIPEEGASVETYTRLSADSDGESNFSDEQVALDEADFALPAPSVNTSAPIPVEGVSFVTLPAGWSGDVAELNDTPARDYWVVLAGEMEITTTDGETRQFPSGSILLVEDTTGEGHTTTVVGDDAVQLAGFEKAD